jgi:hypothetical protein
MHAVGGELPVECIEFTTACFLSEMFTASFNVPSYQKHLYSQDIAEMYRLAPQGAQAAAMAFQAAALAHEGLQPRAIHSAAAGRVSGCADHLYAP